MARPRLHDDGYLSFLRGLPCCCGCGRAAPSEAAHVTIGRFMLGKKPDDRFAVPLNSWCHRLGPNHQHMNERLFWERRELDPYEIAARLYAQYGGDGGKPRKKHRKPRQTIVPRGFAKPIYDLKWPKRKIRNRGFNRVKPI